MPAELKGVSQVRYALKNFEPDLAKDLRIEMTGFLKPIVNKARGYIQAKSPLSGWAARSYSEGRFLYYDGRVADRGITYQTTPTKPNRKGFSYSAAIYNKSAIGAIIETAGRTNPAGQPWVGPNGPAGKKYSHSNNRNAGRQFIQSLGQMKGAGKTRGRAIFRAWNEDQGRANAAVIKAIEKAAQKFAAKRGV
jgi:hypothetical protein